MNILKHPFSDFAAGSLLLWGFLISGCLFFPQSETPDADEALHEGMNKIYADGKDFSQGADSTHQEAGGQPVLHVSFSYDFWMDQTEVTQKKYFSVTGFQPVTDSVPLAKRAGLPVFNVSWYDAVFYCNALSKDKGTDTVYSYISLFRSSEGSIYKMEGLNADYSKKGYRLPTEAEWEFAARAASTTPFSWGSLKDSAKAEEYAWYAKNSGGHVHAARSLKPNSWGLYDMAGNVMEWTGGWKGDYTGGSIRNSLGAAVPNSSMERAVKGGAFNYGLQALRFTNREATYPTISSARTEYVGFRCVLGTFQDGEYYTSTGVTGQTNPVRLSVSKAEIRSLFFTDKVKLCFVNVTGQTRNLSYIDFHSSDMLIQEIRDTLPVFHPAISPDGGFAAFCTRSEGTDLPSSIYIRRLDPQGSGLVRLQVENGCIPRWWTSPTAPDTFIIYTNSSTDNKNRDLWSATSTFRQKISNGMPAGAPELLNPGGSFHDGLSADGKFLATGFSNLILKNLITGNEQQLFLSPENGKDASGSIQVCNVSISPDPENPLLAFLDFGYPRTSSLTNGPYGVHQYIFVADSSGKMVSNFRHPDETDAWDHTEWSNLSRFLISGSTSSTGEHQSIYIIDYETSEYFRIIDGTDIQHPALWIFNEPGVSLSNPDHLDMDSLGQYNEPANTLSQERMAFKMQNFWNRRGGLEILFVGSSRIETGIDCGSITGLNCYSMGVSGGDFLGSRIFIREYVLNHCPNMKAVVMDLVPGTLFEKNADLNWTRGIGSSKGFLYDKSHSYWKNAVPVNFDVLINSAGFPDIKIYDDFGCVPVPSQGWGAPEYYEFMLNWDLSNPEYQANISEVFNLARAVAEKQIHFMIVNFPVNPAYKTTVTPDRYGPERSVYKAILDTLQNFSDQGDFIHFYDANLMGEHDYLDEDAANTDHLSGMGSIKISRRLDSLLHVILN